MSIRRMDDDVEWALKHERIHASTKSIRKWIEGNGNTVSIALMLLVVLAIVIPLVVATSTQIGEHFASRTPPGDPARRPTGCMLHPVGLWG